MTLASKCKRSAKIVATLFLYGSQTALTYPAAVLNPWRTPGIERETAAKARKDITLIWEKLKEKWLQDPKTLSEYAKESRFLTLNARRSADKIAVGQLSQPLTKTGAKSGQEGQPTSITLEPLWCTIADQHLFSLNIIDTSSQQLIASAHHAIAGSAVETAIKEKKLAALVSTPIENLLAQVIAKAQASASKNPTKKDALHVGLKLARHSDQIDEGDTICLINLAEEQLAARYQLSRFLGLDHLLLMQNILEKESQILRPTRIAIMDWNLQRPKWSPPKPKAPTNPLNPSQKPHLKNTRPKLLLKETKWLLRIEFAESVFGGHILTPITSTVKIDPPQNGVISLTLPEGLSNILDGEQKSLLLSDYPIVSKVYGAWAYLDRGRAWGLKMDDRMVAKVGKDEIKGHVVRFFGPEADLKSPRGFPIREGAILYIRKGQNLTKTGLTFAYDPQTFPTDWPQKPNTQSP